jgi:ribosomal protein L37AE/L43A
MKAKNKCPRCNSEHVHRSAKNVAWNVTKEVAGAVTSFVIAAPLSYVGNMLPGTAKYAAGQRAQELGDKVGDKVKGTMIKKYICSDCGHERDI